ncbi:hypothetical protein FNU79_18700 [Deinococcus detaillensis]|uniref:Uncharacterized protein n=1 Tax=Deinococcus detaillensis TaxID=2592048 RepID=A0A553UF17_9DEIO|nr:hypothetical protein [Deinococcus detaillensis]TSA78779.1 hypothetical protein FNU79_18700 [Deinococcus detaillensis]
MPTDEQVLEFSNPWYRLAIQHTEVLKLTDGLHVRVITAPYFLATKLVAFQRRGERDYRMSHDISDVMSVLDGRPEVVAEIVQSDQNVRTFLSTTTRGLLTQPAFLDTLAYPLLPDAASQVREELILRRLGEIAGLQI